jgi:hypothetical protein
VPEFKTLKTGFAQVALAVLVTGGVLLFGGLAANASNGKAGQSQIPCGTIIPGLQRGAAIVPQPCPTITLDTTTTSTTVVTTTEPETTTSMVETSTTAGETTTTAVKPAVQPRVLARTGSNTAPMVGLAVGLLAAGGIVLSASRKRAQV